jgi:hypothetical protein
MHFLAPGFTDFHVLTAGLTAYLIFWAAWLPNPKLAILGSLICGCAVNSLLDQHAGGLQWALQGGFVFLQLHSLRWNDAAHAGANAVRMVVALAWCVHSFIWVNLDTGRFWMPLIPATVVLAVYGICQWHNARWDKLALPGAAAIVFMSGPCSTAVDGVRSMPVGLLAISASFMLLGLGTVAALTRHHWHKCEPELKPDNSSVTPVDH